MNTACGLRNVSRQALRNTFREIFPVHIISRCCSSCMSNLYLDCRYNIWSRGVILLVLCCRIKLAFILTFLYVWIFCWQNLNITGIQRLVRSELTVLKWRFPLRRAETDQLSSKCSSPAHGVGDFSAEGLL